MTKNRLFRVAGAAAVLLLVVGLLGATVALAQDAPPEAETTAQVSPRRWGGLGCGLLGMARGDWTLFDTAAEALGLSPEQLFSELHAGKTLEEVAESQGVELDKVQAAIAAVRTDAMRQSIEQAVEAGEMTQEQADWMLEGLEKGYAPMGAGHGFGRGGGRPMGRIGRSQTGQTE